VKADRAGWFVDGTLPGDIGPAVIAGHVDSLTGPAVFWRLHELRSGDFVWVTRSDRTVARFRVIEVAQHPRAAFPTARVYGPTPEAALRLITCAGDYDRDRGEYRDNIVVYAVRA
jgi:sortase (surface protein transpeptidase)